MFFNQKCAKARSFPSRNVFAPPISINEFKLSGILSGSAAAEFELLHRIVV